MVISLRKYNGDKNNNIIIENYSTAAQITALYETDIVNNVIYFGSLKIK